MLDSHGRQIFLKFHAPFQEIVAIPQTQLLFTTMLTLGWAASSLLKLIIWVKVFKNGPSKICGREPLKNFQWYGLFKGRLSGRMT